MTVQIIGDIHGDIAPIDAALSAGLPIIQIGDFGFAGTYESILHRVTPDQLRIVGGNHDEYPELVKYPHYMGDFGLIPGTERAMFVRGAYSIDRNLRTPGFDWWEEEELSIPQFDAFLTEYERIKPLVMISHESPRFHYCFMPAKDVTRTRTVEYLKTALLLWQPLAWIHGHHHRSVRYEFEMTRTRKTEFVSLGIGEVLKIELP